MAAPGACDVSPLLAALVRARVASGAVTESGLASVIGSSQCHMSNWLRGRKRLGVRLCDAVMFELGVSASEVLASAVVVPAPVLPVRGVLLVMPAPGPKARRSPWRRRVDPARIARDSSTARPLPSSSYWLAHTMCRPARLA